MYFFAVLLVSCIYNSVSVADPHETSHYCISLAWSHAAANLSDGVGQVPDTTKCQTRQQTKNIPVLNIKQ